MWRFVVDRETDCVKTGGFIKVLSIRGGGLFRTGRLIV